MALDKCGATIMVGYKVYLTVISWEKLRLLLELLLARLLELLLLLL